MNKKILIGFLVLLSILSISSQAQESSHSPYSRFGVGDLNNQYSSYFNALGGGVSAVYSSKHINNSNPATYSAFKPNSFLFSTGGSFNALRISNNNLSHTDNITSLSHIILGCRLNSKTFASAGLVPYSSIGYNLSNYDYANNANLIYTGNGGLSKVYFGGAYLLAKNLSVGANASYIFGGLNRSKRLEFNDEAFFNSRSNSLTNITGVKYDIGALYTAEINDQDNFTLAFTTSNSADLQASRNTLSETFAYNGILEVVKDTSLNYYEKGTAVLPKHMQLGFTYKKDKKWLFVLDYLSQDWSDYRLLGESDSLKNSVRISSGLEYTPEFNSISNFWKRCKYRFGVSLNKTPLDINNTQIEDKSISIGIGIPVKKNNTIYDLSVVIGQRGTLLNNLIQEEYIQLSLSVSFDGIWFVERKYD